MAANLTLTTPLQLHRQHLLLPNPQPSLQQHRQHHLRFSSSYSTASLPVLCARNNGVLVVSAAAAASNVAAAVSSEFGEDVMKTLGSVTVFAAGTGKAVKFRNLWDQKKLALELLTRLVFLLSSISFHGQLPFPMECLYADPERKAYDVLGLYYGIGRTFFNPASLKVFSRRDSLKRAAKNYTIAATPDDSSGVLQQGGMFVFRGKELLYARKDEGTGDHAPLEDIFDVCCNVPVT